jgi:predicted phosphohydrolase
MKIQYCSDLHLEFKDNKAFLTAHPLIPNGDILILAGDIVPFAVIDQHADFFDYVSDHFTTTYWIPGNHEYYMFDAADKSGVLNVQIRKNVFLVNNHRVLLEGIQLVFTTLWSDISPVNEVIIQQSVNDFHSIRYNGVPLSVSQFNQFHQEALAFLADAFTKKGEEKMMVVTHHVPTRLQYPEKYVKSPLNDAFAVELHDFIAASPADYWVYGHHHINTPPFTIGNTVLLTNQLGYLKYGEEKGFDSGVWVEV